MAISLPQFPGVSRKNDALFLYGASQPLPFVRTYLQEETEIVHGPSCKPEREIDLTRCENDGVPVRARRGGGGTVVLAPGVVVILVVGMRRKDQGPREIFSLVHKALIAVLETPDIRIAEKGLSDLAIENRKILGSSLYLQNNPARFYYQSSLIVDMDFALMSRYLLHPPKEPDYRLGRDHLEFCTSLRQEGWSESPRQTATRIQRHLGERIVSGAGMESG